jgi:isopentenyl diphosphate isomerase/L-lactate dehydrogenase-like FMN-dependent dehydrogenase
VLVAPMGLQGLCCVDAEVASVRAAASLGLGHCLSMFSSRSVEEVATAAPDALRWQQVYLCRDREVTGSLLRRAEAAGCAAVVVTVDVPAVGRRTRDERNRFDRFRCAPPAIFADPYFRTLVTRRQPGDTDEVAVCGSVLAEVFPDDTPVWRDVAELIRHSRLPVLVKGILHPADARLAVETGAAGIVVSNHGGRQFDRSVAAVDALAAVVDQVHGAVPVLFDSGVRRGSHVAAALALGARAVLVGRPVLWGLAVGGQAGARRVLAALVDDLEQVLRVTGVSTLDDLGMLLGRGTDD